MYSNQQNELIRKKRLGQFFSGPPLARLLASIADGGKARSIIDPMCGDGDMLEVCQQDSSDQEVLVGIEIDPDAHKTAHTRLSRRHAKGVHISLGNCFSRKVLLGLPRLHYQMVITNPPYIRYQSFSQAQKGELSLPS